MLYNVFCLLGSPLASSSLVASEADCLYLQVEVYEAGCLYLQVEVYEADSLHLEVEVFKTDWLDV